MKVRWVLVAALASAALVTSACSSSKDSSGSGSAGSASSGGGSKGSSKTIGLLEQTGAAEFDIRGVASLKAAIKDIGWKLVVADSAGDLQKANTQLTTFATQGVDAAIVGGYDLSNLAVGMAKLKAANIPVIETWSQLQSTDGLAGQIAVTEADFGAAAAKQFVSKLKDGDSILALTSDQYYFGQARLTALKAALATKNIKIVGTHQTDYANAQADSTKAITDLLNAHPDVEGIWTDSSIQLAPVVQIMKSKDLCGKLEVTGFYGDLQNLAAVRDGCADAILDVPQGPQNYAAMDLLANLLYNKVKIPDDISNIYPWNPVASVVIDKSNVPSDTKAYFDVSYDYRTYFVDKWNKGQYGPTK
ncbi:MAG: hypothetical protein JWM76_1585 [Pseudonocardiales bacterium]|nr:hypothetical protein [Pseudonocardiales bacterium]